MKRTNPLFLLSSIMVLIVALVWLSSCKCDEKVYIAVLAGERSAGDCETIAKLYPNGENLPSITYVCPGESVTICWGGNVASNEINAGVGAVGNAGSKVIKINQTTTITITPKNSCAAAKSFTVEVISGPTLSTWDARWAADTSPNAVNSKCGYLSFNISEYFMSPSIKVLDAEAKWDVDKATGSACTYPPLVTGKNVSDLAGSSVQLNRPFEKVPFSKPPKAVGEWRFAFEDPSCQRKCDTDAVLPFELTLDCPDQ